ncbi:MAG TPA: aminotransferase class V-fold PLP-dependent enzyme [Sphingomicrobium sp.]|nr:aminotransferase class V-fold PLP-dependent enzyme [Sphingomicrobium sp.]
MTVERAQALDAADPLAHARGRFSLPDGLIYLDGHSLGALPKDAPSRLAEVIEKQWGEDLITSWNKHGWIDWPHTVAAKLTPIVGARPSELVIADSTSVCLFKLIAAAFGARPGKRVILTESGNFPTDNYVMQGIARLLPEAELRIVERDDLLRSIGPDIAVLSLTHADYLDGQRHDLLALNHAAKDAGALTVWDMSHSAGVLDVNLNASGCELAVGCGYKYLNGGPGAPAWVYVADHLQAELESPLSGWIGHSDPFAFAADYSPAEGIRRFLTGTPAILGLAALDAGLDTFRAIDISAVEAKAAALTGFFIDAVEQLCGIELARQHDRNSRGGHVIVPHEHGYAIMRALIDRGVIGDFRTPNLMRFGFAPLYTSFDEAWRAAGILSDVLRTETWREPRFATREKVT